MAAQLVTCECNLVWRLHQFRTMMRENAVLRCSCGRELLTWSGPFIYTKERVQTPEDPR